MDNPQPNQPSSWVKKTSIIIGIIFCIFLVTTLLATADFFTSVRKGDLRMRGLQKDRTAAIPQNIEPWMTFDYVNRVFGLPPDYVKEKLTIDDPRYPMVEIKSYAKKHSIDPLEFTGKVRETVMEYRLP
ncbi:MAG: hypothetical protein ACM3KM_00515 [Acidobacteriaceae bacterium]